MTTASFFVGLSGRGGGVENWGLHRRLLSRGGSLYARTILGLKVRDVTAGFVCYRREVLELLGLNEVEANGYGFQIEMKYRCAQLGFRLREAPIVLAAGIYLLILWPVVRVLSTLEHRVGH